MQRSKCRPPTFPPKCNAKRQRGPSVFGPAVNISPTASAKRSVTGRPSAYMLALKVTFVSPTMSSSISRRSAPLLQISTETTVGKISKSSQTKWLSLSALRAGARSLDSPRADVHDAESTEASLPCLNRRRSPRDCSAIFGLVVSTIVPFKAPQDVTPNC